MDWVSRQSDEITNKLFSWIVIIPPKIWPNATIDGTYGDFVDRFSAENREKDSKLSRRKSGMHSKADGTDACAEARLTGCGYKQAQNGVKKGTGITPMESQWAHSDEGRLCGVR